MFNCAVTLNNWCEMQDNLRDKHDCGHEVHDNDLDQVARKPFVKQSKYSVHASRPLPFFRQF